MSTVRPATKAGQDALNDLEVLWGKAAWASYPWGLTIATIEADAAALALDAAREHMGCACAGIEGHLASRGFFSVKEAQA